MKTPEVSKEEFLEAISTGVMHGIVSLICRDDFNGKYLGKTPQERILDTISDGIGHAMPISTEILETIEKATFYAMSKKK